VRRSDEPGADFHDDVLVDVREARVGRGAVRNRRVERLGMAYLPGCGTEKALARYSGKSFHDRYHAKIGDGAQRFGSAT